MSVHDRVDGFTLIEVLVATTLVCTAVAGLAQLGLLAMAQSLSVQRQTAAFWLAQSKLEELRARPWTFDSSGLALSDPALSLSPSDALMSETGGIRRLFRSVRQCGRAAGCRRISADGRLLSSIRSTRTHCGFNRVS